MHKESIKAEGQRLKSEGGDLIRLRQGYGVTGVGKTILAALVAAFCVNTAAADTYPVTNMNDSGSGSFRQAIIDANRHSGADIISFDIPGSGVRTITPATKLPVITSP